MCPNDRYVCGISSDLTARKENIIESRSIYSDLFSEGSLCRYRIKFPAEAMNEDRVAVKLNNLENVTLHAIKTKEFSSPDFKKIDIQVGGVALIEHPYELYLIISTDEDSKSHGSFSLSYQYLNI